MKEAKAAHQAESRIYEAAVAIQSKVRQMQATLQHRNATITSSEQQGLSQAVVPKTQAGTILEKILVQSKQGESLQLEQNNSGKSLRSKQDKQAQQNNSGKYLRSKRSKQGHASPAEPRRVNGHKINDNMPKISAKQRVTKSDSKQRRTKKGVEESSTKKGVEAS